MSLFTLLRGLKGRITLLALLPMLAVAILASGSGVYSLWQLRESRLQAALDAAAFRAENMLNEGQVRMGTYAVALAQQAALVNAIASGDAALIRHRILNSMEMLRANDPRVSVLEVTDAQGRILMRGHNPNQAGDDKSGLPDVARALRGEIAPGITLSPTSGELAYGGVVPLRQEGLVVGTLKVAGRMEIDIARQIGRLVDGEVMLFGNGRMRTSTIEGLDPVTILPLLAPESAARRAAGITIPLLGRGDYRLRVLPVTDLSGEQSGAIVIALPMAVWHAAQNAATLTTLLAAGLVLLVALPVALIVARRIALPLEGMTSAMAEIAAGNLNAAIPGGARRDEIGAMAEALAVFQQQARDKHRLAEERERAQNLVRVQEARYGLALRTMTQGVNMFDADSRLVVVNPRYEAMFGIEKGAAALGMHFDDVVALAVGRSLSTPEVLAAAKEQLQAYICAGKEVSYVREMEDGRSLAATIVPMEGGGWLATYEDITERKKAEAKVAYLAKHDALTGLPNRLLFRQRMDEALMRARRGEIFAVLCLDLDRFKAVNDTLGHHVGDLLLHQVTERLKANTRETDTVARLGGDEFAIIQSGVDQPQDATMLSRRLIEILGEPFEINDHTITIGASIGIAMLPEDGFDAEELLKNADLALYRAKAEGRSTFRYFESDMDAQMQARRLLELDLRQALTSGQFELFYQPYLSTVTRQITGFEALIRWRHPERGLVPPDSFIPLAEEIGLIVPIGEWVLRTACAEAATWTRPLKVSVNVSPAQFGGFGPVSSVKVALQSSGLDPARLELEITETVLLDDTASTLATLAALKALGVSIAMDDFGTGYSSLSYLRQFPFDRVKIDKSFIANVEKSPEGGMIVDAVTTLCRSLGMATTVEGVETDKQLQDLIRSHCTHVQGFLFSKPRPAQEIEGMLTTPALVSAD